MGNGVPFQENAIEQCESDTFAFSANLFLADAPCVLADNALSSTLAETIDSPSATVRFRVLCGHTRESWQKTADLI